MGLMARDWPLWVVSSFIWRLPGKTSLKLAGFSHTEQGSGLDMLAATEETTRREMRARYFRHALDELKHAGMFKRRAAALAPVTKSRGLGSAARSESQVSRHAPRRPAREALSSPSARVARPLPPPVAERRPGDVRPDDPAAAGLAHYLVAIRYLHSPR